MTSRRPTDLNTQLALAQADVVDANRLLARCVDRLREVLSLIDMEHDEIDGLDVDQTVNALIRSRES